MPVGTQRAWPTRPSLGSLFWAACAAWVGAIAAEQLSWAVFCGTDLHKGVVACVCCLVVALLLAPLLRLKSKRAKSWFSAALRPFACIALGFAAAFACGMLAWGSWAQDMYVVDAAFEQGEVQVVLVSDPAQRDYGRVSTAKLEGRERVELRLLWPDDMETIPSAGQMAVIKASFNCCSADESGKWNQQNRYVGMANVTSAESCSYAANIQGAIAPFRDASFARISALDSDASGLLAGVLLGNRTLYAGSETEQDFKTTGLAHLMAVSGTHLAVVTALLTWVLVRLRMRRSTRNAFVLVGLVGYVALTCFSPSAVRACTMVAVATVGTSARRRRHVPSALAFCVLVFLCLNPALAFSMAFQLSVLSVLGLVVFSPLLTAWLYWLLPARLGAVCESLAATLAATLLTLPVTVSSFAQMPLISPVANIFAAPLVTLVLGLGVPALFVVQVLSPAGNALLVCAGCIAQVCIALVHVLADVPGACIPLDAHAFVIGVSLAFFAGVLWAFWPKPKTQACGLAPDASLDADPGGGSAHAQGIGGGACAQDGGGSACAWSGNKGMRGAGTGKGVPATARVWAQRACLLLAFALPAALIAWDGFASSSQQALPIFPGFKSEAQIVMVDVGQGDCMLVRDGDAAVLIDTGPDDQALLRGLARQGITHLDAVIITHKDSDHCGALGALAGVVSVDHVFVHADLLDEELMDDVFEDVRRTSGQGSAQGLNVGDKIGVGSFTLTLLAPQDGGESGNEDSLVHLIEYDAQNDGEPEERGLVTGDAEQEVLEESVEAVGDVDFVKVPHHGSKGAFSAEQLAVLKPELALIGVGADNSYGHPSQDTLYLLEESHTRVFRTDTQGDIEIFFNAQGMSVYTQYS